MKIVILADSISTQSSGIHYYGVQFVERLLRDFPNNDYHLIASKKLEQFDIPQTIIPLKAFPLHLRFRQIFSIPKAVKKLNPDHVIELAHFGPFRLDTKIKRTTVIHDLTPIYFPAYHSSFSHWMHKLLMPGIIKKADSIIVNSSLTKEDVIKFQASANSKLNTIFPDIDIPNSTQKAKHAQGKYLLTVGTIEPRKNYKLLIDAFKSIGDKDKEVKLVIVGKMGWKMDGFQSLIDQHPHKDRIIITGFVTREELWSYYENARAFVFTSNYEGFGIPVLEACYHGLPLLLSDVPTSIEIAEDAAIYFNKENTSELSEKTITLLASNDNLEKRSKLSKERYPIITNQSKSQLENWVKEISSFIS